MKQQASSMYGFHRGEEQTKNCAVCSILFFWAFSSSREVIVAHYNKSNRAVHLPHTQAPTLFPSSLCLSLLNVDTRMAAGLPPSGFSFYHVERCLPAGQQIKGRWRGERGRRSVKRKKRGGCGTMQGRFWGFNWEKKLWEWQCAAKQIVIMMQCEGFLNLGSGLRVRKSSLAVGLKLRVQVILFFLLILDFWLFNVYSVKKYKRKSRVMSLT